MKYYNKQTNDIQSTPFQGALIFPDEFFSVYHTPGKRAAGFVTITDDGERVTSCVWNEEAYQMWVAENPEPDPVEQKAAEARAKRDQLLAESDWTQVLDAPIDTATRDAYRVYRQALRDIPEQDTFPDAIQWPDKPGTTKASPDPVDSAFDVLIGGDENA